MERCSKDIVKVALSVDAAGVLGKEKLVWTIVTGERFCEEIALSGTTRGENRIIKRKYADHREFLGQ